jgi:plasmid maintenance system killer protein
VHRFGGDSKVFWIVKISGNLRLIFAFEGEGGFDVDLIDTH